MKYFINSFLYKISSLFGQDTPSLKETSLITDKPDLHSHVHLSYADYERLLNKVQESESISH